METKSLYIIQKLAKIGKVLSKIVVICSIVGMVGCLVGIISLSPVNFDAIKIGGVTIHNIIEKSEEVSMEEENRRPPEQMAKILVGIVNRDFPGM